MDTWLIKALTEIYEIGSIIHEGRAQKTHIVFVPPDLIGNFPRNVTSMSLNRIQRTEPEEPKHIGDCIIQTDRDNTVIRAGYSAETDTLYVTVHGQTLYQFLKSNGVTAYDITHRRVAPTFQVWHFTARDRRRGKVRRVYAPETWSLYWKVDPFQTPASSMNRPTEQWQCRACGQIWGASELNGDPRYYQPITPKWTCGNLFCGGTCIPYQEQQHRSEPEPFQAPEPA